MHLRCVQQLKGSANRNQQTLLQAPVARPHLVASACCCCCRSSFAACASACASAAARAAAKAAASASRLWCSWWRCSCSLSLRYNRSSLSKAAAQKERRQDQAPRTVDSLWDAMQTCKSRRDWQAHQRSAHPPPRPASQPCRCCRASICAASGGGSQCLLLILLPQTAQLTSATIFWCWGSAWPPAGGM